MVEIKNTVSFEKEAAFYSEAIFTRYKTTYGFLPLAIEYITLRIVSGIFPSAIVSLEIFPQHHVSVLPGFSSCISWYL